MFCLRWPEMSKLPQEFIFKENKRVFFSIFSNIFALYIVYVRILISEVGMFQLGITVFIIIIKISLGLSLIIGVSPHNFDLNQGFSA